MGYAARRDQQLADNRGSAPAPIRQPVLAKFAIHVTQFAVSHVAYDDTRDPQHAQS
jgi:hypothetical protein